MNDLLLTVPLAAGVVGARYIVAARRRRNRGGKHGQDMS
ncbi:hypothetical protein CLV93_103156 [Prolixibacter denitrificans]|uniref:Uncharacterized protein n=1 Tax=Prolixibacter denitrificans TaxID=1541063 RepID=A0A2P8CFI3_9BACT|nr:hypothetical protein CLV93_103156 [Prolixibacter denitrificans]